MKKTALSFICIFMLAAPCHASELLDTTSIPDALPYEAEQYLEGASPENAQLDKGLSGIAKGALSLLRSGLRKSMSEGFIILAICLLNGVLSSFSHATESAVLKKTLDITAVCAITALCISGTSTILSSCQRSIAGLRGLSAAIIPVFAAAIAISGRPVSAVSTGGATMLFSNLLMAVAANVLIPAIYSYLMLSAAGLVAENKMIASVAHLIKKATLGFFKYFLVLYTVYISLSGLIASGTDAVTLKTAKMTISGTVPVLGSIVSDVTDTILSGAVVLKNAIGIYGFLAAIAVCLVPFVAAMTKYIVFRLLAMLSTSMAGGTVSSLLESVSDSYGIALGLLGTCCALQLLSFVISTVVMKT